MCLETIHPNFTVLMSVLYVKKSRINRLIREHLSRLTGFYMPSNVDLEDHRANGAFHCMLRNVL